MPTNGTECTTDPALHAVVSHACVVLLSVQVSRFSLGQYAAAVEAFSQCVDMRRRMCEVPGDARGPVRPWEDHLPHPELAASFVNVTVRSPNNGIMWRGRRVQGGHGR